MLLSGTNGLRTLRTLGVLSSLRPPLLNGNRPPSGALEVHAYRTGVSVCVCVLWSSQETSCGLSCDLAGMLMSSLELLCWMEAALGHCWESHCIPQLLPVDPFVFSSPDIIIPDYTTKKKSR